MLVKDRAHERLDTDGLGIGCRATFDVGESFSRNVREAHGLNHNHATKPIRNLPALTSDGRQPGDGLCASRDPNVRMPSLRSGVVIYKRPTKGLR